MSAWGNPKFAQISVVAVFMLFFSVLPALASDTTPPVLTSFTFSPMAVDTTTKLATITVTAQVTDDLSGVEVADPVFVSPSGLQGTNCGMNLISGTGLNGTFQCTISLPAFSEAGIWTVSSVSLIDNVGNRRDYLTGDLVALGFPTTLQVTSNQDTTPPVLTSFTFSPMAVDTTTKSATITVTAQVTDDLSGVEVADPVFVSPSGLQGTNCGMNLISGTGLNGTFQCTISLPAFSEAGIWTVSSVSLIDNVGNRRDYLTGDLVALGFPTTLQVTSNQDTTPPVLTSFTFSPMAVDTTTKSATITVTAQVTDDLSGVEVADPVFVSPSGLQGTNCGMNLISGTGLNGTFQCTISLPAFSEAGTWTVSSVSLTDNVGNRRDYLTGDLVALGFPTQLIVDSASTVVLASATDPSSYEQLLMFTATVTSSNGNTPTGTVNFNDGSITIGSGTLNASGVTTFTTSALALGSHTIVAEYLGDPNNPAADSGPLIQVVNSAATTTTIASSRNPSKARHPVTFTASVSFANGIPPDGDSVEFFDGQGKLGTGTLSNGTASLTTSKLAAGLHQIWAKYLGDTNLQASKAMPLKQKVKP